MGEYPRLAAGQSPGADPGHLNDRESSAGRELVG